MLMSRMWRTDGQRKCEDRARIRRIHNTKKMNWQYCHKTQFKSILPNFKMIFCQISFFHTYWRHQYCSYCSIQQKILLNSHTAHTDQTDHNAHNIHTILTVLIILTVLVFGFWLSAWVTLPGRPEWHARGLTTGISCASSWRVALAPFQRLLYNHIGCINFIYT